MMHFYASVKQNLAYFGSQKPETHFSPVGQSTPRQFKNPWQPQAPGGTHTWPTAEFP